MRWTTERRAKAPECDKTQWHQWFAWHPVQTLHNEWAWLETVDRKGRRVLIANGDGQPEEVWSWTYA